MICNIVEALGYKSAIVHFVWLVRSPIWNSLTHH